MQSGASSIALRNAITEPAIVRWLVSLAGLGFMVLFLVMPLIAVFVEALRNDLGTYLAAVVDPDTQRPCDSP